MSKIIPLTQGKQAIVDDEDFEWLNQWKWHYQHGYASRKPWKNSRVYMHRLIMGIPVNMEIDHINGNGLDNQKENLRICTKTQNQTNIGIKANNASGYKGVYRDKWTNKWHAYIKINKVAKNLGRYDSIELAAKAYDLAAKQNFGEFARLNFPEG